MAVVGNWTYSGNPADSPRDAVRFLIRDTDEANAKVSDEEIDWLISEYGANAVRVAIIAADAVASSFSNQARTKTVGALSITYEASATEYRLLAKDLRLRLMRLGSFIPYAGGISVSDKRVINNTRDRQRPNFYLGMFDNPGGDEPSVHVNPLLST